MNVLVATPGRLLDHLKHTTSLRLHHVSWLVLDEADRLLDRGFEEPLREVLAALAAQRAPTLPELPARRQTVLCSATLDSRVQALAATTLVNPVSVRAGTAAADLPPPAAAASTEPAEEARTAAEPNFVQPSQLQQAYTVLPVKLRLVALLGYVHQQLRQHARGAAGDRGRASKGIVFFSTRDTVDLHHALLSLVPPTGAAGGTLPEAADPAVRAAIQQLQTIVGLEELAPEPPAAAAGAAGTAGDGWDLPQQRTTGEERRQARRALRLPIRQGALFPCPLYKLHGQLPAATRTLVYKTFCDAREVRSVPASRPRDEEARDEGEVAGCSFPAPSFPALCPSFPVVCDLTSGHTLRDGRGGARPRHPRRGLDSAVRPADGRGRLPAPVRPHRAPGPGRQHDDVHQPARGLHTRTHARGSVSLRASTFLLGSASHLSPYRARIALADPSQIGYVERLRGRGVTFAATEVEELLRALPLPTAADDSSLPARLQKEMRDNASEPWQRAATFQQLRLEAYLVTSPVVRIGTHARRDKGAEQGSAAELAAPMVGPYSHLVPAHPSCPSPASRPRPRTCPAHPSSPSPAPSPSPSPLSPVPPTPDA